MKRCKDCVHLSYCIGQGFTTENATPESCHLYTRIWWKFWRPA